MNFYRFNPKKFRRQTKMEQLKAELGVVERVASVYERALWAISIQEPPNGMMYCPSTAQLALVEAHDIVEHHRGFLIP